MGICKINNTPRHIVNQLQTKNLAKPVSHKTIATASKGICKINLKDKNLSLDGFFLDIHKQCFLFINYHLISEYLQGSNFFIEIVKELGTNIDLKLNKNERYIKIFEIYDLTAIEIKNSDGIRNSFDTLKSERNYINNLPKDVSPDIKNIFSLSNSGKLDKFVSIGQIKEIDKFEFIYEFESDIDSLCYPVILTDNCKVIGINILNKKEKSQNHGIFIKEIFQEINNDLKNGLIKNNKMLSDLNNSLMFESRNMNNYIIAELYIDNNNINKDLYIINSYEERMKILQLNNNDNNNNKEEDIEKYDEVYNNENEIKECKIKINDENIDFSYVHKFKEKGKYKICYTFDKKLTNINYMFYKCSSLINIDLSNFNTDNIKNMRGLFMECSSLINVNITNINTINVFDMGFLFSDCSSLVYIDLSTLNTQKVIYMESMFSDCSSLINLNLSNFITKKAKFMGNMFFKCEKLEQIDLSSFNTENVYDMSFMFFECSSLKNLDLSNFNTKNVKNMCNMFKLCYSLDKLNLSNFNTENVTNMENMFAFCSLLKDLEISNFNVQKVTKKEDMFKNCISLKKTQNIIRLMDNQ